MPTAASASATHEALEGTDREPLHKLAGELAIVVCHLDFLAVHPNLSSEVRQGVEESLEALTRATAILHGLRGRARIDNGVLFG